MSCCVQYYSLLWRAEVAATAEVKVARSCDVNSLLSGPPRLPSPLKMSSCERSLYWVGNFHLFSKSWDSFFSKHPTIYFPMLGRNLNALFVKKSGS